jgi:hypothetical protein
MKRTGSATLPLHGGKAPAWLFSRMVKLAREIVKLMASDYGPENILHRISDPYWFQALGCVLGFDWHSSGVTTTVCGALKEGIKGMEHELGLFIAGGKGGRSRRTPAEIVTASEILGRKPDNLVYASKISAKVDNTAVQDGFTLYHHNFFFTRTGEWAVVQQGMNDRTGKARRYHWLGEAVDDFVNEPHAAVCGFETSQVLNLVASESKDNRINIAEIGRQHPDWVVNELKKATHLHLPDRHQVLTADISPKYLHKVMISSYETQPGDFESLLALKGMGPKSIRALSLIAEVLHGEPPSFRDPARFSFAHGGKDGYPYPVDRKTYDQSIQFLHQAVEKSRIGDKEKTGALKRLSKYFE